MKEETKFPEQEAPRKNTDDAFVKVGKDGSPEMPERKKETEKEKGEKNESGE